MKVRFSLFALALLFSAHAALAATDLEMGTTSEGTITLQSRATCADLARGSGVQTAQSPSVSFDALRIKWNPKNRDLFVRELTLTFKSPKLIGGEQAVSLSSVEIASLLGVASGIISADEVNGNKSVVSNRAENRDGYPLCALTFGPLNFASANPGAFAANVTVELTGLSVNSRDGSNQKNETKSFKTTARFY